MKKKLNYSWVMIVLCFLIVCVTLGLCSSGRTMYLTAITDALGFKRSAFSLNDTFRFVTTTIVSLFFGPLVNKFGPKKLVCAGFICLISFALINSFATQLWMFYAGGVLLGVGLAWTTTTMMSAVVNIWTKEEHKGKVTGAILSANGLGGAIAVQILTPIIFEEGNPFGYRNSYTLVAIVLAIVLALVIIFFRDKPKGAENVKIEKKQKKVRGRGWVGMEYKDILRKPYFYLACVCIAFTGMGLQGLGGITIPHMYDVGLDKQLVATISSTSSIICMFTKFLTGFMYISRRLLSSRALCALSA